MGSTIFMSLQIEMLMKLQDQQCKKWRAGKHSTLNCWTTNIPCMKQGLQQTLVAMEVELRNIQDANETILHVSNRMTVYSLKPTLTPLICVVSYHSRA